MYTEKIKKELLKKMRVLERNREQIWIQQVHFSYNQPMLQKNQLKKYYFVFIEHNILITLKKIGISKKTVGVGEK